MSESVDTNALYELFKRERSRYRPEDEVAAVLHVASHLSPSAPSSASPTSVTSMRKPSEVVAKMRTVNGSKDEASDSLMVVYDYLSYISSVYPKMSGKNVPALSMFKKYIITKPLPAHQVTNQWFHQFKKGAPMTFYQNVQKGLADLLVGTKVAFGQVVYELTEENLVFQQVESFQKWMTYLTLDRLVLDHEAVLTFNGCQPVEDADAKGTLLGTSLARTVTVQASRAYDLALFSAEANPAQCLTKFHQEMNDALDVFLALCAYYMKMDVNNEFRAVRLLEEPTSITWQDVTFSHTPAMVAGLERTITQLSQQVQALAQKDSDVVDLQAVYGKMNEQVTAVNALQEKVVDAHTQQIAKQNELIQSQNQLQTSQTSIIELQNAIRELLVEDKQAMILNELRTLNKTIQNLNGQSEWLTSLETMIEPILNQQLTTFGDVLGNKIVARVMPEDTLQVMHTDMTKMSNLLSTIQADMLARFNQQASSLQVIQSALTATNAVDMTALQPLLQEYLTNFRNEVLSQIDQLAQQFANTSQTTAEKYYQECMRLSQQLPTLQQKEEYEALLQAFATLRQEVQTVLQSELFGPSFVQSLAEQLGAKDTSVSTEVVSALQDLASKQDFQAMQTMLTEQMQRLFHYQEDDQFVENVVHGAILDHLAKLTGKSVSFTDVGGLAIADAITDFKQRALGREEKSESH